MQISRDLMVIPFTCVRIRSREARNPRGHFGGVPFRHVRIPFREIATSRFALLAMTVAKCRSAWFAGGRGTPLPILSNVSTNVAYLPAGVPCRRDEGVPTTLYQSLYLPLFNVISTEARVKPERSGEIPRDCHPITILQQLFSTLYVGVADGRAVRPRTAA